MTEIASIEQTLFQSLEFDGNVGSLVKRQPPANGLGLPCRTVFDNRIGVQTGAGLVAPSAPAPLPRGDDPAPLGCIAAGGERSRKHLVVVGPRLQSA